MLMCPPDPKKEMRRAMSLLISLPFKKGTSIIKSASGVCDKENSQKKDQRIQGPIFFALMGVTGIVKSMAFCDDLSQVQPGVLRLFQLKVS